MVRVKTRWMLLRLDFEDDSFSSQKRPQTHTHVSREPDARFPSRKEIYWALRDAHLYNFGIVGGTSDIQVRWADPHTRLVLVRVPRSDYPKIRATLTLTTTMVRRRLVVSLVCVNGGVRTAKRTAIQHVRAAYQRHFRHQRMADVAGEDRDQGKGNSTESVSNKQIRKDCAVLEQTLSALHAIEF